MILPLVFGTDLSVSPAAGCPWTSENVQLADKSVLGSNLKSLTVKIQTMGKGKYNKQNNNNNNDKQNKVMHGVKAVKLIPEA